MPQGSRALGLPEQRTFQDAPWSMVMIWLSDRFHESVDWRLWGTEFLRMRPKVTRVQRLAISREKC